MGRDWRRGMAVDLESHCGGVSGMGVRAQASRAKHGF